MKKDKEKKPLTFSDAERARQKDVIAAEEEESRKERSFLDTAMKRLKACIDGDSENRRLSIDDLKFSIGNGQWNSRVQTDREKDGRPCLQFDLLTENINQVVGDQRHNKIKSKVAAVNSDADPEIARIRQGLISNVEYSSSAERIYDYAMEMLCRGGYGAWELSVRYTEENPFLQEIYIQRIENPHTVYLGPGHDECYADSKYGFKLEKMTREDFEAMYPDAEIPGTTLNQEDALGSQYWWDGTLVTVADYYVIKMEKERIALLSNGRTMPYDEAKKLVEDEKILNRVKKIVGPQLEAMNMAPTPQMLPNPIPEDMRRINPTDPRLQGIPLPPQMPPQSTDIEGAPEGIQNNLAMPSPASINPPQTNKPENVPGAPSSLPTDSDESLKIVKERDTYVSRVKHYTITANEILSKNGINGEDFPGSFIPLVLVRGPEINIEGKSYIRSFIRPAKDPQRNYNYWVSAAAESVALAPKAEWIGTAKQFQGYENDYASSNVKNLPMLKYNIDDEFLPGYVPPPPQRVSVKDPPIGIFTEIQNAKMAVKDALGMHGRDVGEGGPERSGAAITAAQTPSDVGSFSFFDNLKRAIEHSCRVINAMIPDVYDSERDIRIYDETDKATFVPINTTIKDAIARVSGNPTRYSGMNVNKMKLELSKYGEDARFNDITAGKYNVVCTTGPAYATQRAESSEQMLRLASVNPQIMQLGGDLIVKGMDFLYAEELAERLEKTLPPGVVKPKEGEPPPPPPGPTPEDQLISKMAETEQLKQQNEMSDLEVKKLELKKKMGEIKLNMLKTLKEIKGSDEEVRKQVIKALIELNDTKPPTSRGMQQ